MWDNFLSWQMKWLKARNWPLSCPEQCLVLVCSWQWAKPCTAPCWRGSAGRTWACDNPKEWEIFNWASSESLHLLGDWGHHCQASMGCHVAQTLWVGSVGLIWSIYHWILYLRQCCCMGWTKTSWLKVCYIIWDMDLNFYTLMPTWPNMDRNAVLEPQLRSNVNNRRFCQLKKIYWTVLGISENWRSIY